MKRIETSDDRGFDEPRVMRDEATRYDATRYEQSWRDKYDDLSRAQCHERLAAADARSDLDTLRRAAFAAAVSLGAELPDDAGPNAIAAALRQGAERACLSRTALKAEMAPRYEDSDECAWETQRERPAERLDDVSADEADPRDAVNERIAKLPREQRHEAMRRASCSYSAPCSAVRDGACIEGNEVVWPDGERYPMAPWHSSARGED